MWGGSWGLMVGCRRVWGGAVLAALAGTAFTLQYGEADFFMGYFLGFKALTAAAARRLRTVTGALAGGLLLGLFEALFAGYFSSAYKDVAVFAVLSLVLIFRREACSAPPRQHQRLSVEANFAGASAEPGTDQGAPAFVLSERMTVVVACADRRAAGQ